MFDQGPRYTQKMRSGPREQLPVRVQYLSDSVVARAGLFSSWSARTALISRCWMGYLGLCWLGVHALSDHQAEGGPEGMAWSISLQRQIPKLNSQMCARRVCYWHPAVGRMQALSHQRSQAQQTGHCLVGGDGLDSG